MAWGARQEDGVWRLCERRGRTIVHACARLLPDLEIRFPGRAMAEDCAHKLNDLYWPQYEAHRKKHKTTNNMPFAWMILAIVRDHKGISQADYDRLFAARKEQA